jgi:sugar lactone lactonase YvrE
MDNFIQRTARLKTTLFLMILSASVQPQTPVVPPNAKPEVASTVAFTEGPAYHADGSVYFTDTTNNRIMRSAPGAQAGSRRVIEVYRQPSGRANGLVFDLEGRLVACEGGSRRVTRTERDIDPDRKVTRVIDDLERPNGTAVSPDQKTLYVVDNNNGVGGSRKVYASRWPSRRESSGSNFATPSA